MTEQRLPPHDTDAEEAVIGSLLIDGSAIYQVATLIEPSSFYSERNGLIYSACLELYRRNEAINQITLAQELDRQGKLEGCGGAAYFSHLISIVPTSLDIEHYAAIVYRLAVMRNLISAGRRITDIGYAADPSVDSSLGQAEDILFRLRRGQFGQDLMPIRQVLDKYFEDTAILPTDDGQPAGLPNVPSGFTGVDEFLGGFQRSDLVIAAGRPSMGKTSLALNIARNAAVDHGAKVAIFSLEMSREALVMRLLSSEARVNLKRVRFGQHQDADEERRIMEATGKLAEAPIFIDDSPQLKIVELRSKARRLYHEHGLDLILVDYLQLMQGDGKNENRVQEISYISRSLKSVARDLNVPLIAVSQLSRAVEWRSSHRPQLSDLRESGSIEQDADVVMFIYREEVYVENPEEWKQQHPGDSYPPPAEVIIAKHRNGPTGSVNLRFISKLAKFENLANAAPKPR